MGPPADTVESASPFPASDQIAPRVDEGFREFAESLVQNIDEVFFWREADNLTPHFVSHAFERIFGRPCTSVYQDPSSWFEAIHPEDRDRAVQDQLRASECGEVHSQYRIVKPGGEVRWIWLRMFPAPGPLGRFQTLIGVAQDCTERIHAVETQAFLASIVESSDDSIIGTDMDGRIVSWNRGARLLFGYEPEEAIGNPISLLFSSDDRQDYRESAAKVRRLEEIKRFESVRFAKGNRPIDVSIIMSPIKDSFGKVRGVSAIYRDITLQKLANDQLVKAKDAAEVANRAKSEFLANISHELRTPMNGILGMAQILTDTALNEEQSEYLGIVRESAESLLLIISDLLDFSKIEARKLVLDRKAFRVRETMDAILGQIKGSADTKNLSLRCVIGVETPQILEGDQDRLRQVLLSLLGNAIKFTRAGSVELHVGRCEESPEALRFSVQSLSANKIRTFLTALGLVIGNASVILVVTISITSRDYILDQIRGIGSNLIYAQYEAGTNTSTKVDADLIKLSDVEAVRQQFGSRLVAATGIMTNYDRLLIAGKEQDISVIGSDEQYQPVRNLILLAGRFMDASDVALRHKVAMLTPKLANRLYGGQLPAVGQIIKLHGLQFTVIGTFKERTETFGQSEVTEETVLIPITVIRYFTPVERIDPMYVQARLPDDVPALTGLIKSLLESRHRSGARYRVENLA
ncbi:MAG: ABC transporter permease, partial [Acidobacteriota bacterium]